MHRSEIAIDLGALARNVATLRRALGDSELWAVVKADAYGHGATEVAAVALEHGAEALCVATVAEGAQLRLQFPLARILVMGPTSGTAVVQARAAGLELCVGTDELPEGLPIHVKLDTGMGRWGLSELPVVTHDVVGLMTHLATADSDVDFAREQVRRFDEATAGLGYERHAANSAAALRLPEARFDAARCGIALYGLSPFGTDPADDGLEPVLSWRSHLARVLLLRPGQSTGYGRRFTADRDTWVGIVPVGYADGFRRDLTGTAVLVDGEPGRVVGTVSMDAFAVELPGPLAAGTAVTIIGDGLLAEAHARFSGTITYELVSRIETRPQRALRDLVVDA